MTSGAPDDDKAMAPGSDVEMERPPSELEQPPSSAEEPGDGGRGSKKKEKSAAGQLFELVAIVAVALGLALGIQAFLIKPYRIPSESMVPTLQIGQRVLVNRIGARFTTPDIGDVVVFHPPAGAEQDNTCGSGQPAPGGRRRAGRRRPRAGRPGSRDPPRPPPRPSGRRARGRAGPGAGRAAWPSAAGCAASARRSDGRSPRRSPTR